MIISSLARLRWLSRFVSHLPKSKSVMSDLHQRAKDPSQEQFRWNDGDPISSAHNAHYTNTTKEVQAGLSGNYNFMEGDIWMEGALRRIPLVDRLREPIMAHYPDDVKGLSLQEWLEVGKASGKGLKLDIKQSATIPKIIEQVEELDIPDERLIFNADMVFGPGVKRDLKFRLLDLTTDFTTQTDEMMEIREAFPDSTIGVGFYTKGQKKPTTYTEAQLNQVITIASELGGPITFPLRAEFVTPKVVEKLKPHGTVSVWNDPKSFLPPDLDQAKLEFRKMGVDGMIDLRDFNRPERDKRSIAKSEAPG